MDERYTERFENYTKDETAEQKKELRAKRVPLTMCKENIKGIKQWFFDANSFMSGLEVIVVKYGNLIEIVEETEKAVYLQYEWDYEEEHVTYEGWFPKSTLILKGEL